MYAPGKTAEQCAALVAELLAEHGGGPVILTRADDDQVRRPWRRTRAGPRTGRTVVWRPAEPRPVRVPVVTAGTADLPVADECAATLHALGIPAPPAWPTAAWPASTASSPASTSSTMPTPSSSSPAWRARCRAWSAASPPRR